MSQPPRREASSVRTRVQVVYTAAHTLAAISPRTTSTSSRARSAPISSSRRRASADIGRRCSDQCRASARRAREGSSSACAAAGSRWPISLSPLDRRRCRYLDPGERLQDVRPDLGPADQQHRTHRVERRFAVVTRQNRLGNIECKRDRADEQGEPAQRPEIFHRCAVQCEVPRRQK